VRRVDQGAGRISISDTLGSDHVREVNTLKLDHVAIWTADIELMRTLYEKYFDARSNPKYENERKRFTSSPSDRYRRMRLLLMRVRPG
jgi:hypothetical protein